MGDTTGAGSGTGIDAVPSPADGGLPAASVRDTGCSACIKLYRQDVGHKASPLPFSAAKLANYHIDMTKLEKYICWQFRLFHR